MRGSQLPRTENLGCTPAVPIMRDSHHSNPRCAGAEPGSMRNFPHPTEESTHIPIPSDFLPLDQS
ncbi:unnamed protein product, partial [Staurois parvus]